MPAHKPVLLSIDAEQDLIRLWLHIGQHDPNAADRYIRRIQSACKDIIQFPDKGTPRPDLGDSTRKLVVGDHVVFYDHHPDRIIVLRVFHCREDIDPTALIKDI